MTGLRASVYFTSKHTKIFGNLNVRNTSQITLDYKKWYAEIMIYIA